VAQSKNIAFGEERGQLAGERYAASRCRGREHVGEPRMHGKRRHGAAVRGDVTAFVERLELSQQLARLSVGGGGRRVEPGELARVGDTGRREIERERREIGARDLGWRVFEELRVV